VAPLSPLVTASWLAARLDDPGVRVVDCRFYSAAHEQGRAEYTAAHIPGAIYLSLEEDLTGPEGPGRHPLPAAGDFRNHMEQLGMGNDHTVVAYDNGDGAHAPRLWWMLRSLGHPATHVLDGGWRGWVAESRATSDKIPRYDTARFEGHDDWSGVISREEIVANRDQLTLIDARAAERYAGLVEPFDPVAGHIPGAISIPYGDNVAESGHFIAVEAMRERFESVLAETNLVAYCGSGITACNNLLALEMLGRDDVLLYPGSWSDWCSRIR
jgi:thiosulfate/3-mercaptopyruvate sulfurtransferase